MTEDDDFSDLDDLENFGAEVDEFADLAEFDEPETVTKKVDNKAASETGKKKPEAEPALYDEPAPKPKKGGPPQPIITGHCAWPQTENPHLSHERCQKMGGGMAANPAKRFHPCPCPCHFPGEHYDCGGCTGTLAEAPYLGLDEDGDPQYVHVDAKGRMLYIACGGD